MLAKQIKKKQDEEAAREKRKKGSTFLNQGEFLDRKKQRFDITQSSMAIEGDFVLEEEDVDENKEFNMAVDGLKRSSDLFLSMNE